MKGLSSKRSRRKVSKRSNKRSRRKVSKRSNKRSRIKVSKRSNKRSRRKLKRSIKNKDGVKKSLFLLPLLASSATRPCENYSYPPDDAVEKGDRICLDNIYKTCKPYIDPYKDAIKANDLNCLSTLSIVDKSDKSFDPLNYISRHGTVDAYKIFLNKGLVYVDNKEVIINNVLRRGDIKFLNYLVGDLGYKFTSGSPWDVIKNIKDLGVKFEAYVIFLKDKIPLSFLQRKEIINDIITNLYYYLAKNKDKMAYLINLLESNEIPIRQYMLLKAREYNDEIQTARKKISFLEKEKETNFFSSQIEELSTANSKLIETTNLYYNLLTFITAFLGIFFIDYITKKEDTLFSILKIDKENKIIMNDILFLLLITCNYDNILKYINEFDLSGLDRNKNNAIHYIISHCDIKNLSKVVELLLEKRPELVNEINNEGDTPLHALYKKVIDTSDTGELLKIKYILVNNGANRIIENKEGKIPEYYSTIECPICLENIRDGECELNCGHIYHCDCIRNPRMTSICPTCRKNIISIKEYN